MNTITYKKFVQFKNSPNDKEGEKDENKTGANISIYTVFQSNQNFYMDMGE